MSKQSKFSTRFLTGYDLLILSAIVCGIALAISLWIWYGYKEIQIENQISQIK